MNDAMGRKYTKALIMSRGRNGQWRGKIQGCYRYKEEKMNNGDERQKIKPRSSTFNSSEI